MNLLKETVDILKEHDLTLNDVVWWGNLRLNEVYTINNLEESLNFVYNKGYGRPEINENLIIVGYDWWLERHEYDGAEWWEFKRQPEKPIYTITDSNEIKEHLEERLF
jgi:prophage pi3 protein